MIFGKGRVGRNLSHYLQSQGCRVDLVGKALSEEMLQRQIEVMNNADIVLAAIPDSLLGDWFDMWHGAIGARPAIHFSGAIAIEGMHSFHPLYSFPETVLSLDDLKKIAFACDKHGPTFSEIFPQLSNTTFVIEKEERALYHALAVLSGNFASFLWNQSAKEFDHISNGNVADIMGPYLESVLARFKETPFNSLTGPMARRDRASVEANRAALETNPELKKLYEAFLANAWPDY